MGDIIKPHNLILPIQTAGVNYADGLTYYVTAINSVTTVQGSYPLKCPVSGVLEKVDLTLNQTDGTNEGVTIQVMLNNSVVGTLLDNQPITDNMYMRTWPNVNIEIDDVLELKITCPTWATNPTNTRIAGHYLIRV